MNEDHNYPPLPGYTWACERGEQPPDRWTAYNRDCEGCFVAWRVKANNPLATFRFGEKPTLYKLSLNRWSESEIREWYFGRGKVILK